MGRWVTLHSRPDRVPGVGILSGIRSLSSGLTLLFVVVLLHMELKSGTVLAQMVCLPGLEVMTTRNLLLQAVESGMQVSDVSPDGTMSHQPAIQSGWIGPFCVFLHDVNFAVILGDMARDNDVGSGVHNGINCLHIIKVLYAPRIALLLCPRRVTESAVLLVIEPNGHPATVEVRRAPPKRALVSLDITYAWVNEGAGSAEAT